MRLKAGIFDLGRVVVYSDDSVLLDDVRKTLGLTDKQVDKIKKDIGNLIYTSRIKEEDYLRKIDPKAPQDLLQRTFIRDFKFIEPTLKIIRTLRENGIKLAALSNTIPQHIEVMRKRGVFDFFDVSIISCEVGLRKPDPKIYELTLERLGVMPEQAFFTDDREENVEAARKIGIKSFLFESPGKLKRDLENLGLII